MYMNRDIVLHVKKKEKKESCTKPELLREIPQVLY